MKCDGVLIISGEAEENSDDAYRVSAQCDGGSGGDCRFHWPLHEWDGDKFWFITSDEFDYLQERHLTHSGGAA